MKKKGQAAMEFLMTYGWAILAAIIVIGVLAIYFRPSTLVSNSAVVTAPLYATGVTIDSTGYVLEIKNNGGEEITTQASGTSISGCTATAAGVPALGTALAAGDTQQITFTCGTALSSGTINEDIAIAYTRSGVQSTLVLTSTGTVSGSVP